MLTKYYDEFTVGEAGQTHGRTITESDLVMFAALSGDWHLLHTNTEYAEASRFGQRIAHGMLVLSVMTGLVQLQAPYAVAFYGMDDLRLLAPTFIGDTLSASWRVADMKDRGGANGLIGYEIIVRKSDGTECARCVMRMLVARQVAAA